MKLRRLQLSSPLRRRVAEGGVSLPRPTFRFCSFDQGYSHYQLFYSKRNKTHMKGSQIRFLHAHECEHVFITCADAVAVTEFYFKHMIWSRNRGETKQIKMYLFIQLLPILIQFWQRLVTQLEELGLGIHQRQHLPGSTTKHLEAAIKPSERQGKPHSRGCTLRQRQIYVFI